LCFFDANLKIKRQVEKPARKFTYKLPKLSNGKTVLEALLLYKYSQNWTESQWERAVVLFKFYPEIENQNNFVANFGIGIVRKMWAEQRL